MSSTVPNCVHAFSVPCVLSCAVNTEVLLEFDKSSMVLKATPDTLLVAVESELRKIGLDVCLLPFSQSVEELEGRSKVPYKMSPTRIK